MSEIEILCQIRNTSVSSEQSDTARVDLLSVVLEYKNKGNFLENIPAFVSM